MDFLTPPPLEPGDRVAVLAPSSGGAREADHVFELGLRRLRDAFGLEPVVYPTARQGEEFLPTSPCGADIHAAVRDPEIRGIVATIGGDDQLRVLRHLDTGCFASTRCGSTAPATTPTSASRSGTQVPSPTTARN